MSVLTNPKNNAIMAANEDEAIIAKKNVIKKTMFLMN